MTVSDRLLIMCVIVHLKKTKRHLDITRSKFRFSSEEVFEILFCTRGTGALGHENSNSIEDIKLLQQLHCTVLHQVQAGNLNSNINFND